MVPNRGARLTGVGLATATNRRQAKLLKNVKACILTVDWLSGLEDESFCLCSAFMRNDNVRVAKQEVVGRGGREDMAFNFALHTLIARERQLATMRRVDHNTCLRETSLDPKVLVEPGEFVNTLLPSYRGENAQNTP